MKSLTAEKRAELEKRRTELQIKLWLESYSALEFFMEKDYPFEPASGILRKMGNRSSGLKR